MAKYQIILRTPQNLPDDEFFIRLMQVDFAELFDRAFKADVIEARNLEGIRSEVWQKPKAPANVKSFEDLL